MTSKKSMARECVVAVDIGTSKIVCLVGEIDQTNELKIVGFGQHPSKGLKRGVVVNIEATVLSIQKAVEQAEKMADYPIRSVYTGIAGGHIRSFNSHGIVAIGSNEVSQADLDRVIDAARAVAIPADQKILHILPQEFIIDQQDGIKEPIGMSGVRLEAKVHLVTGAVSSAQNIDKCIRQCGLFPLDIIIEQLASSYSVLNDDEKELGVCVVDIGGGTTDIAVFTNGAIRHTAVIPIAGDQVTNDIAIAFRTPTRFAESVKINHGSAVMHRASSERVIEISGVADRPAKQINEAALAQVIQPRYEELFSLVRAELRKSGFDDLIPSGIVLTGGASKVKHLTELAESTFGTQVRIGAPTQVAGLPEIVENPCYATAIGLLMHGLQQDDHTPVTRTAKPGKSVLSKMKCWLQGNL
jgi:cell division protein FtsA